MSATNEKKKILFEMAKNGEPKPSHKERIGKCLRQYTCKSAPAYDGHFDYHIRYIRPDWFFIKKDPTTKKQKILELAAAGAKRSELKRLGLNNNFTSYTCPTNTAYDPHFTEDVKQIAPWWFK